MIHFQDLVTHVMDGIHSSVCAFIVDVEGSAYLKEGTWMLLKSDE